MAKDKGEMRCAYLYADGHMVVCYEKPDRDAGSVQYCHIYEQACEDVTIETRDNRTSRGRIVIHHPVHYVPLILKARAVDAIAEDVDNGSERSKRINLPVGHVSIYPGPGYDSLDWITIDGVLGGPFCIQPNAANETYQETVNELRWGDTWIAKRIPAKTAVKATF